MRHVVQIDREWVERREAQLRAEEDAAIRAARETATTEEERELVDELIEERERNRRAHDG